MVWSPQTRAAPSLASDIFSNQGDRFFLTKKKFGKINELAKIYLLCARSCPNLRIHSSNKAQYADPKEGEVVLFRKTKRPSAFNSPEMERKRTWTLTVHLSKSSTTK